MTRVGKGSKRAAKRSGSKSRKRTDKLIHPAWGAMKGMIRIMPGVDVTQPADPDWADYLDKKYGPEKRRK